MTHLQKTLSGDQAELIYQVALSYYLGLHPNITAAIDSNAAMSQPTFYRWKREFPEDFHAITQEARLAARQEKADAELSLSSAAIQDSIALQNNARRMLSTQLKQLELIITTRHEAVTINGSEVRNIIHYPRDRLGALRLLWEISREGVIPEAINLAARLEEKGLTPQDDPQAKLPLPTNLPSSFQSATIVAKDGHVIEIRAPSVVEIIEGEVVE